LNHSKRFSVLVVRGDGHRVLRFSCPRRLLIGVSLAVAGLGAAVVVLVGDWWELRRIARESASGGATQTVDHGTVIDAVNQRLAELRDEVASWGEIHARIRAPFGPDDQPWTRGTGIGGALASTTPVLASVSFSDELDALAEHVREAGESLRALDRLIARAGKALASLPSSWPVRGSVNSEFGLRRSPWSERLEFHGGMDIAAERGTPVRAPAAGRVHFAGRHAEYGLTVILDHGQEIRTLYGHLGRIAVSEGASVERGAEIGLSGNTGRSTGPHLHYEIAVKGQSVNPRVYLWD
jgi:murein DD-endopeptidase MepM/ murein hydrolase activator NlpD